MPPVRGNLFVAIEHAISYAPEGLPFVRTQVIDNYS